MNALLKEYNNHPVKILAFPCNQFGLQEPGHNDEILNGIQYVRPGHGFVPNSNIHFFAKGDVNGKNENKLFTSLKKYCPPTNAVIGNPSDFYWSPIKTTDITWNFGKFLLDKTGTPRYRFNHGVDVMSMKTWIDELLYED